MSLLLGRMKAALKIVTDNVIRWLKFRSYFYDFINQIKNTKTSLHSAGQVFESDYSISKLIPV